MCDIQLLLSFDTFGTAQTPTNNFIVNKSCAQVAKPFDQYCLIPPPSRLAATSTCSDINDPEVSFLFTDVLAGKMQTLHDLPVLFESFLPIVGSTQVWVPHTLDTVNSIQSYPAGPYNGQRFLPPIITRFIVSDDNKQSLAFFNVSGGTFFTLYALDMYGMYRAQTFSNGTVMNTPQTDAFHGCFQSQDGVDQYALLLNVVYTRVANGTWSPLTFVTNPPPIYNVLVSRGAVNCTALQGATRLYFTQPFLTPQDYPQGIIWSCFTQNRAHIVICGFASVFNGYAIAVINATTGAQVQGWEIDNSTALDTPGPYTAITTGNYVVPNSFDVLVQRPSPLSSARITLATTAAVAFITLPFNFTITSFVGQFAYLLQTQPQVLQFTSGASANVPFTITAMTSNSQGTFYCAQSGPDTWFLPSPPLPTWTQTPIPLYLAEAFAVNDEYKMDAASTVLVELWYLGRLFLDLPTTLVPNSVVVTSRHNRFRVLVSNVNPTTPTSFANVTFRLERMNEYYVLTSGNYVVTVTEDANLKAGDVWQSNTPDQFSDPELTHTWSDLTVPIATVNGLYILFRDTQTIRIAYNVFNSALFKLWCDTTPEYRSRGIQAQADFCVKNLLSPESNTVFLDLRCGCVAGAYLLPLLFPGIDMTSSGRLEQVMPCVVDDCGKAFGNNPEVSNAYAFTDETCRQDLTMCADLVRTGTNTNIQNLTISQNCGTDFNSCLENAECPLGTACINGQCTVTCGNDTRCIQTLHDPFARCDPKTGQCLFAHQTKPDNSQFIMWMVIVGFGVATLIVMLVILALFAK